MRTVVASIFPKFTETFEGHCAFLYCDIKGLVTTGRGNLVDPVSLALPLPWQIDDVTATEDQIAADWNTVKARQDIRMRGGGAYEGLTQIRLTEDAIDSLTMSKAEKWWPTS
jgi:GH24 family phage-related lysozyme (muramidase)